VSGFCRRSSYLHRCVSNQTATQQSMTEAKLDVLEKELKDLRTRFDGLEAELRVRAEQRRKSRLRFLGGAIVLGVIADVALIYFSRSQILQTPKEDVRGKT